MDRVNEYKARLMNELNAQLVGYPFVISTIDAIAESVLQDMFDKEMEEMEQAMLREDK